jgi:CheY-like chemotaxis protein
LIVWLVEDSATDAYVIGEALKLCGLSCVLRVVGDGDAAISMLREVEASAGRGSPDLILLDLNVPKVPGLEVLSALRQSACCGGVPVVVVTSSDSNSDLAAIRELGATSYFRKPHDLDAFLRLGDIVRQALNPS